VPGHLDPGIYYIQFDDMKTYWKILLTVLPLVLFFLFQSVGTTHE
jgi:hypothetical protein